MKQLKNLLVPLMFGAVASVSAQAQMKQPSAELDALVSNYELPKLRESTKSNKFSNDYMTIGTIKLMDSTGKIIPKGKVVYDPKGYPATMVELNKNKPFAPYQVANNATDDVRVQVEVPGYVKKVDTLSLKGGDKYLVLTKN